MKSFLSSLKCGNGKLAYFRALRGLCTWPWKQGYISNDGHNQTLFGMRPRGVQDMPSRLNIATGIKYNAHNFRRGFACNLHRKGLSTLDIMHLGGWEDLSMVLRYTRGITFEDCLEHYEALNG